MKLKFRWEWAAWAGLAAYPVFPFLDDGFRRATGVPLGPELTTIFIYAILTLGLNVVTGWSGILQLGMAAFFGIGAYVAGILTVPSYPFQIGFWWAVPAAMAAAAAAGILVGAPTLRLRGDYLALVTLGFGEVVRFAIQNLDEITNGTRGLNPLPPPGLPIPSGLLAGGPDWGGNYRWFYYLALGFLALTALALRNLERSRLGRAWLAIREDELAAGCTGVNPAKARLSAFAVGSAVAGLAGCLYATKLTTTAGPGAFDFNRSITALCCLIVGGMGSLRGALLGTFLLIGFDNVAAKILDTVSQQNALKPFEKVFLETTLPSLLVWGLAVLSWWAIRRTRWSLSEILWPVFLGDALILMLQFRLSFTNLRLIFFGLALILMMRFRPEGVLPERRG